jgi:hypothetical protein
MPIKRLPPPKVITYDEPESEDFFDSNLPKIPTPKQDGHVWKTPYVTPHKLGDKDWMVKYLVEHWDHYNATLFEGKMKRPLIYMSNAIAAERFRNRGMYYSGPGYTAGKIRISPNLFGPEDHKYVDETLLHEMCHQYVWHVLHISDRTEAGHGPAWQAEMIRIGLKPSRYDENGNDVYMRPREKEAFEKKRAPFKQAVDILQTNGYTKFPGRIPLGTWAACYDTKGTVHIGIVSCTYNGKYILTINLDGMNLQCSPKSLWMLPADKLADQVHMSYELKQQWEAASQRVINHYAQKKADKQMRKDYDY